MGTFNPTLKDSTSRVKHNVTAHVNLISLPSPKHASTSSRRVFITNPLEPNSGNTQPALTTQDGTPPSFSWKNCENHSFNFSKTQERSPESTPLPPQKDLLNSQDENIIERKIIPLRQKDKHIENNPKGQADLAQRIIPDRSVQVEEMKASGRPKTPASPHSALLHNLSINLKTPPPADELDQEQHGTNAVSDTQDTSGQQKKTIKISFSFSFSFTFN